MPAPPQNRLLQVIRRLPTAEAQNRLMSVTDRELALSMMYLSEPDRNFVLSYISGKKSERVREELRLQQKIRITYTQYSRALNNIVNRLQTAGPADSMKSYLRPYRKRGGKK